VSGEREQEIAANLERAESSLDAARVLLSAGHPDEAASQMVKVGGIAHYVATLPVAPAGGPLRLAAARFRSAPFGSL
jgi:hypothetical protein